MPREANERYIIHNQRLKETLSGIAYLRARIALRKKNPKIKPKMPKKVAGDARLRKPCHARLRQGAKAGNAVKASSRHGSRAAPAWRLA